ncbi:halocyanin domain-containing protein [Halobacteriales archaeon QH_2_65_14]|nr:MAG: halocyanin domain-containing protein [Halobacteriales archaeon QH_2_65_14]
MDERESTRGYTRRRALKAGAGVAAGVAALGGTGGAAAQSDAYGGHLQDAEWDGTTADASGMDEVVVDVGAGPNGLQFGPEAIYIEPGTTIQWVWTGEGSGHNVVPEEDGPFDSREAHEGSTSTEPGFTYEFTFEEAQNGVHPYFCGPHRALGMLGVIVVGEDNVETELVPYGEEEDGGLKQGAIVAGAAMFGVVALAGAAAYRELIGDETE